MTVPWQEEHAKEEEVIITAASTAYAGSLLALLGSLNVNWPSHPRVVVYDLGLERGVVDRLVSAGYEVRAIEPFCTHWRKHFAWKIWCWNDAPAQRFLWLDAGVAVLQPLDEIFHAIRTLGYFVVPTHHPLTENASIEACLGCGVAPEFRQNRMTYAGGIIGFDRSNTVIGPVLRTAMELATVEKYLRATEPLHRHDQALISLLLHRDCGQPICSDAIVYGGWTSPRQIPCQKIWVHRRAMHDQDQQYFARHFAMVGPPRMPLEPRKRGTAARALASLMRGARNAASGVYRARRPPYQVGYRLLKGRWPGESPVKAVYDGVRD